MLFTYFRAMEWAYFPVKTSCFLNTVLGQSAAFLIFASLTVILIG